MPRSVFEIDVNDARFKNFLDLYKGYHDSLASMKGFWTEASDAAAGAESSSSTMVETLAAGAASTALISDAMSATEASSGRAAGTLGIMAERAKGIAGWITDATIKLAKWGVLSLGAGLIGGGVGLFGLDRMGEGMAGTRRLAQGLGISTGELNAFNVNFGPRLGLGADFLDTIQSAKADLGERWKFTGLGIPGAEVEGADTARLTADVIQRAHALWQQAGAAGHNTQWMQAHGLGGIMSFSQWQQIGAQSQGDLDRWSEQYQRDARSMSVSDPVQKDWTDFVTQLQRAGTEIDTALIKGLDPLIQSGALPKLSDAIVHLVDKFFANHNVVKWVDDFSGAISHFGDYLGSEKFQNDMKTFVDDIAYAAEKMVYILRVLHLIPQTAAAGSTQEYGPGSAEATANLPGIENNSLRSLFNFSPGGWADFSQLEKATGTPASLLYGLGMQESGMRPHPPDQFAAGEQHQGMFQMSESMQRDWGVTNPYSAQQESQATARAEASYLQRFKGNVAEAIAAWYEGPGGVQRQIDEANKKGGDWLQYTSPDVQRYVASVAQKMHVQVSVLNQTGAQVAIVANAVRQ